MARAKYKVVPRFRSLDELVEFFDTQDMGDYVKDIPEAKFKVDIKRRTHLFALDAELASKLTEIAKSKQTSTESLINTWLKEKIEQKA
jgi:isocitrate lyase